ncbi:hypothetical protein FHX09_001395 [Rhizobium sp. BK538]|nr:hypothetical protein [Rhizobium sp. BK060]MBB4167564.1 hypothetical protein [Rhizobium sp. BK538]
MTGIADNPTAIGTLTITVARLYNKGVRDRDTLLSEAIRVAEIPRTHDDRGASY